MCPTGSLFYFFSDGERTLPCLDEESVVEHLICTQMTRITTPAPILGLDIHYPPTCLMVLLNDFTVQTLPLSPPYFGTPPPLLSKGGDEATSSPLKNRGGGSQEPFELKIKQILQKSSKHPLMKAGASVNLTKQECLEPVSYTHLTLPTIYSV